MKIDSEIINSASKLAQSGFNNKSIYENLNISKSAFYKNVDLIDSIKKGRSKLREEVSNALLTNAKGGDTTSLIFLAKRLNLFSEDVNIDLNSPQTALKSLEKIANADISLEHKNSLKSIISDYIKAFEIVELEARVSLLEKESKQ